MAIVTKPQAGQFAKVLTDLASDQTFRANATQHPEMLLEKYKLTLEELEALRQAAGMSGADLKAVDKVVVRAMATSLGLTGPGLPALPGMPALPLTKGWKVSCCSCCCCCCGETAVTSVA